MKALTHDQIEARLSLAIRIAGEAGRRAMSLRESRRWTGAVLADVGDHAVDGFLQGWLRASCPDDGLLSEETKDSAERLGKRCVWIVDPIDGTREYSSDRHDWAVHVALVVDGVPALGVVALPAIDRVMAGISTDGIIRAQLFGSSGEWPRGFAAEPAAAATGPLRLAVSRSHAPPWMQGFAEALGGLESVPCGSVGFKVAMLLFGKADIYVHKRGLKEWDTCAPEVVARAAGFTVCRFDGTAQRYNQHEPRSDEIVVCRPWLRDRVLRALVAHHR